MDSSAVLIKCPDCGGGVPGGAEMCPACGFPLAGYEPPALCPDCGEESPGNALFCEKCGYQLLEHSGFGGGLSLKPASKPKGALHIAAIAAIGVLFGAVTYLTDILALVEFAAESETERTRAISLSALNMLSGFEAAYLSAIENRGAWVPLTMKDIAFIPPKDDYYWEYKVIMCDKNAPYWEYMCNDDNIIGLTAVAKRKIGKFKKGATLSSEYKLFSVYNLYENCFTHTSSNPTAAWRAFPNLLRYDCVDR
jgi:hypothetical protein